MSDLAECFRTWAAPEIPATEKTASAPAASRRDGPQLVKQNTELHKIEDRYFSPTSD